MQCACEYMSEERAWNNFMWSQILFHLYQPTQPIWRQPYTNIELVDTYYELNEAIKIIQIKFTSCKTDNDSIINTLKVHAIGERKIKT